MKRVSIIAVAISLSLAACTARDSIPSGEPVVAREGTPVGANQNSPGARAVFFVPESVPQAVVDGINADAAGFFADLRAVIADDSEGLLVLADKQHALSASYAPADLVPLEQGKSYVPGRSGLSLRTCAEAALERMSSAARADGVTLVVNSSYRSYDYQAGLYERNVRELGQAAADRESARPGTSQHQLGTAIDLGSITDDFADTAAGKWIAEHGGVWGWSLSYPQGYEGVTGYRWESWHWRYVGTKAALFQRKWFGDVQQFMLETIDAWERYSAP